METAIDIQYDRLCQWLLDRSQIPKDWSTRLAALQARAGVEFASLPPLPGIMDSDAVGFEKADRILMALIAEEEGQGRAVKSVFGRYNDPRVRLWDNIRSEYRKGNLFLAEMGQQLVQLVKYDIPALKSEAAAMTRSIDDLNRHAREKQKHSVAAKEKYEKMCKQQGIDPCLAPRPQLEAQPALLQDLFQDILIQLKEPVFAECIAFFNEFVSFSFAAKERSEDGQPNNPDRLLSLGKVMALETAISSQEASELSMGMSQSVQENDIFEIPWDDEDGADLIVETLPINDADDVVVESIAVGDESNLGTVDLGQEDLAEAVSLLDTHVRLSLRTDLIELQFFLMQRISELQNESFLDVFAGCDLEGSVLPHLVHDLSWTRHALDRVVATQLKLDSSQIQRLLKIRSTPSYLDRLVASFETLRSLEKKCMEKAAGFRQRSNELRQSAEQHIQQISHKVASTAWLKERAERDLCDVFKGKSIKLIGELGNLLRAK